MLKIGIITGSTRPGRVNLQVAEWIKSIAAVRSNATFEVVDIQDYNLPLYNEPVPALFATEYQTPEATPWSKKINELDGFIFVTPEYNRGVTSALKNAIDYLYNEFVNKAAGIVSYGSAGGTTAAQQLRLILTVPQVATVSTQPALNLFTDFEEMRIFKPGPHHQNTIEQMLDQVVAWSGALKTLR
ncbi:NADPH-dependent oxidoreductase [Paenibacillus sp. PCH8]|uniref:NADPH-dependent FMN reductase n=1 Tax=Paenibacillus sp. PCH8 TaxID=2066524 RepID=UPI000CFA7CDF|nr:NADPH-dependent FMN reductase [Paenibacillus sp. PCH8]PQP81014.1 NADPH-dependent oxidoreductase [Paenibacillus sp. PCH8]